MFHNDITIFPSQGILIKPLLVTVFSRGRRWPDQNYILELVRYYDSHLVYDVILRRENKVINTTYCVIPRKFNRL